MKVFLKVNIFISNILLLEGSYLGWKHILVFTSRDASEGSLEFKMDVCLMQQLHELNSFIYPLHPILYW